jgi:hypothetical protein
MTQQPIREQSLPEFWKKEKHPGIYVNILLLELRENSKWKKEFRNICLSGTNKRFID